jgi:YihY family inner membrane protein
MSTASRVPETWELHGDDAWRTLHTTGFGRLLADSFVRLRRSDGFSHARALAFAVSLVAVQATIAMVGFASAVGEGTIRKGILDTIHAFAPGTAGRVLTEAVEQAQRAGSSGQYWGLAFGLVGAIVSGATFMGQMERGLNRLYGIEQDRPSVQKYTRATLLAVTSGVFAVLAFAAFALGPSIESATHGTPHAITEIVRWPVGIVLFVVSVTLLFRWSPRRRQPSLVWLAFGAIVAVALWVPITVLLGVFFDNSTVFGKTYGSLAGVVALLLWALLSSIAVLYGGAVNAQLEAVRAGVREPQDPLKVAISEPIVENDPAPAAVR